MKTLFFLLLSYIPITNIEEIYVEKIVLNHYHNKESGNLILSQYIFYKWLQLPEENGYRAVNWFRKKNDIVREGEYYYFYLTHNNKTYKIKSRIFREINSFYDMERKDCKILPEEDRPYYIQAF